MASTIDTRITRLEFGEELQGCLIRTLLQILTHLCPVSFESLGARPATARLFTYAAVLESPDYDTPSARILTPDFHALHQASHLPRMKASRKLSAELLEQLRGSDVGKPFQTAAHQWPDHLQRVECTRSAFSIDQLSSLWHLLRRRRRGDLRNRPRNCRRRRDVLRRHLRDLLPNHRLQTAQVARLGLYGKRWTYLAGPPGARKTGNKGREIRWFGYCAGRRFPIGECHQIRLNSAYLLQELQRIQGSDHLAQLGFSGLRKALSLQQPFAGGLWGMIALGHLSALAVLFRKLEGGLEEVHEQTRGAVQSRDGLRGGNALETAVAQELTHHSAVFLLDPSLIVLAIRPRATEFDPVTEAVMDQRLVHKLAA